MTRNPPQGRSARAFPRRQRSNSEWEATWLSDAPSEVNSQTGANASQSRDGVGISPIFARHSDTFSRIKRALARHIVALTQLTGNRQLLWRVMRALLIAYDFRPRTLVQELARYGRVIVNDDGVTIGDYTP